MPAKTVAAPARPQHPLVRIPHGVVSGRFPPRVVVIADDVEDDANLITLEQARALIQLVA